MALSCLPEQKQEREQQQMTEVERLQVDERRVCAGVMVEVNMVAAGLKHPKSSGVDEKEKTSIALPGSTVMVVAEDTKGGGKLDEEEGSLSGLQDKWTLDGSVDFRGRPAIKAKTGRWSAGFLVLVNQGLATLAFFGVGVNLVLFLTRVLHQDNADAANNVSKWTGTVYLFSLVGAFMSDSYWGRYKTCVVFQSIFVVGLLMLSGCSYLFLINPKGCGGSDESSVLCENHTPWQVAMFNLSVYLVALGNGGYQPNIATFGADQFDGDDPKESHSKVAFFSYFYLALNLGSLFSNTVLTYVEDEGLWVLGFGVSALSAFLALVLFLVGTPWYRHFRPAGNPLTRVCQVVVAASRKYWVVKVGIPSADELYEEQGRRSTGGSSNSSCKHAMDDDDVASVNGSAGRKLLHTHGFRFLDRAAVPVGQYDLVGFNNDDPDLQHDNKTKYAAATVVVVDPWRLCTVTQVEEVKCVLRLLPIWLCTILYSVVFTQMASLFVEQGASMRLDIGAFRIPPASMSAFDILSVAFFIFFYRRVIDPLVCRLNRHLGGGNNKASSAGMTELQRMGVGLVIAIAAMMAAGTVEHYRLKHRDGQGTGSSLSILWQIPQYALVGASEVFMYVGQLEFFNRETPDGLKSFGSALCMTSISLGNYVSSVIVTIVMKVTATASRGWIPDNLNQGHLDDFYFLLAILTALDLGVYLLCANWYKPSNRQPLVQSDNNSITTTTITSATASPSSSESSRSYP